MKKRYTEEQIIGFLREADAGLPVKELCRKHGFSEPSYYAWKAKFGGMNVSDAQRLKSLEAENTKLKKLLANSMLEIDAMREVLKGKVKAVAARREVVRQLQELGLSERQALRLVGMSASTLRYQPRDDGNGELRERLTQLAGQHRRHGYRMLHNRLRFDGWAINVKRTYRIYREEGLMVRKRRRKKLPVPERQPLVRPTQPNEVWSMDFVFDELANGRRVKTLTVVDDCSKEVVQIAVDTSIPALYVARVLDQVAAQRGLPKVIRTDNGPEFAGRTMQAWAARNGVELRFIQPGKPVQNAYIESFNSRFRDECLSQHWFASLSHMRSVIDNWREDYNHHRPHSTLGYVPPAVFAAMCRQRAGGTSQTTASTTMQFPGL
ncbi:IS3 family transposase [Hydrogenophaga intermedia]|uniref:IS3 family transposase n=1 Tax=Hydrogenophaga intermedia TaxID=65786 RepID=UPI0020447C96|nr:IS3 family transposase [Hydrogenophaga intermedia]MCM3564928.1 IS3 family transposase [Hydrogenophaga intermedia]